MSFACLEDHISADNPIRIIDAFVENIALKTLGFDVKTLKTEGRPSFDTKIFLKLYLYGYLNGLRSSRKLEKECLRNTEMQWLLCGLVPNYHSVSDFRKNNPLGLKKLFKLFVSFLKDADLVAGKPSPSTAQNPEPTTARKPISTKRKSTSIWLTSKKKRTIT